MHLKEDMNKIFGMKAHIQKFQESININQELIFNDLNEKELQKYLELNNDKIKAANDFLELQK